MLILLISTQKPYFCDNDVITTDIKSAGIHLLNYNSLIIFIFRQIDRADFAVLGPSSFIVQSNLLDTYSFQGKIQNLTIIRYLLYSLWERTLLQGHRRTQRSDTPIVCPCMEDFHCIFCFPFSHAIQFYCVGRFPFLSAYLSYDGKHYPIKKNLEILCLYFLLRRNIKY